MPRTSKRRKGRARRGLWLRISGRTGGASPEEFWGTLRRAVTSGNYEVPEEWGVRIAWRNKADRPMKSGDFSNAMQDSSESSRGWDRAVVRYIDRQIDKTERPEAAVPRAAARVRRTKKAARSAAARRGWQTRRRRFRNRSAAARRGWQTRRGKQ